MIRRMYERLFAAFYGWSLKVDGRKGAYNVYYASISLGLALILNVAAIVIVLNMLTPLPFLMPAVQAPKIWWIVGFVALMALQYLYFRYKDRYKQVIIAHGPTEDRLAKGPHGKLIAYMVLSLVTVIGLLLSGLR